MTVFDTPISFYLNPTDPGSQQAKPIILLDWLKKTSNPVNTLFEDAKKLVIEIRNEPDKATQSNLKKRLPGVVTGCQIEPGQPRKPEHVLNLTGWMQIDIDPDQNQGVTDWCQLRDQLINLEYVCFSALSVRGRGVWGLVKVKHPDQLRSHHEQLRYDMSTRYGLNLDPTKGGNPTDLRFYSYDPDARMKTSFKIYDRLPRFVVRQVERQAIAPGEVFTFAENFARKHSASPGEFTRGSNRHHYLYTFCCVLNRCGITQTEAEQYIDQNLIPLSEVKSNAIEYAYRNQSEFGTWKEPGK